MRHEAAEPWSGRELALLLLIVCVGLILRLDFLFASDFRIDSDEAIVGLMAKHISEGASVPVFYYGQHYMGTLEPLLTSFLFSLFGPSEVALKAVPLFFSLLFVVLCHLIGREIGGSRTALLSALFCSIAPATLVVWSAKARGGFIELVCIGALALLWTMRWMKRETASPWPLFPIGLLLGFGWWTNNQILYFMLPIGFVAIGRTLTSPPPHEGRITSLTNASLMGFSSFLLGGLPFWIYNIQHDFDSFRQLGSSGESDLFSHLGGFLQTALPILLGGKRFWQEQDLFFGSSALVWTVCGVFAVFLLAFRLREILSVVFFRVTTKNSVELLFLFVFAVVSVFSLSSFGYLSSAPRYLLPLYVALFPLAAYAVTMLGEISRRFVPLLSVLLIVVHVLNCYYGSRAIPGEPFVFRGERVSRDHGELITWLEEQEIRWVRTNYWIGYRLAFETDEQVRFVIFQEPHQTRIPEYAEDFRRMGVEAAPYVLVPSQAKLVETALKVQGVQFQSANLSGYRVLYGMQPSQDALQPLSSDGWEITASSNGQLSPSALDGDEATRWGSGEPQHAGMRYEIQFAKSTTLRALKYSLGPFAHDFPRRLRIEYDPGTGEFVRLLSAPQYRALHYTVEVPRRNSWQISFPPIEATRLRLVQLGADEVFDWSIAELTLYE